MYAYVGGDPVNWVDIFGLYCCNSDKSVNTNEECCKDRSASEKAGAWAQYQYEQGNQDYTFAADNPSAGGPNQWKCNSFVRDALNKGGGVSWSDLPKSYSNGKKSKYAARANDYANTSLNTDVLDTIDGSNLKPGDIVAWPSSSGSGHIRIVGCDGKIYNARGDGIDRYNPTWGYSNFYYRWKKRNPVYRRPTY